MAQRIRTATFVDDFFRAITIYANLLNGTVTQIAFRQTIMFDAQTPSLSYAFSGSFALPIQKIGEKFFFCKSVCSGFINHG